MLQDRRMSALFWIGQATWVVFWAVEWDATRNKWTNFMIIKAGLIDVTDKPPSVEEYLRLRSEGGLSAFSPEAAEIGLQGTLFAATLRCDGEAIGMGRIVGDGGCFIQVVDIAVDPRFRGQGLGKLVMSSLMNWAKVELPETAFLSLLADVPANKLYEKFGFNETAPASLGMSCRIAKS